MSRKARARGFTLIELMIGMAIGLLSTLAITQIMVTSQGQRRSAASGSDAQVSGMLALSTLRQQIQMAGYGFASASTAVGCPLDARFNGAAIAGFPANLVPVVIADGLNGAPDSIRVLSSTKDSFSVPVRIISPGYNPASTSLFNAFPVMSVRGIAKDDLMVAVVDSTVNCQVFQVTADPGTVYQATRSDDTGKWNPAGFPTQSYGDGQFLVNLGRFNDTTYTVSSLGTLQANTFSISATSVPSYSGAVDIFGNVVNLQAYYGKDTDGDGAIDTWDVTLPTTNATWMQVLAVRMAVVSRSDQYEKEEVTPANLLWDVGASSTMTGAATCGASKCLTLKIDTLSDWKHYRYKVFDSIIPLRNMIWTS